MMARSALVLQIAKLRGRITERDSLPGARTLGLAALLVAAIFFLAFQVNQHFALKDWLFFRYARAWLVALLFFGSSLVGGYGLLGHVRGRSWPAREELTVAAGVGVLAFGLLVFLVGLVRGLGLVSFWAIPALLVAIGWKRCARNVPRFARRVREFDLHLPPWKVLAWGLAVLAFGLLYIQILTPETFGFDERWYHLPMAQRYALTGATTRFEEGFWQQANPHLASYLYAWAFLTPKVLLFDRLEACVHIEFVLFLATFAQVPLLARRLAPKLRHPLSALVLLTFPSIYLYDGNVHGGADHVAGFFAIPTALAALHSYRDFRPANVAVLALSVGALVLTKFTALAVVLPPVLVLSARGLWLVAKARPGALAGLATLVGVGVVISAPLWLRNLLWFGDPLYPFLHRYLSVHPWNADAAGPLAVLQSFMRTGSWTSADLLQALKVTFTFSFVPNDWYVLHRDVPIFGSLFTLTLPCLLFLRRPARLVVAHACIMLAIFVWFMLHHFDRYLQAVLPWMAATTAACFARIWQAGWLARWPLLGLVGLQVVWGSDVPFFRTHNLLNDSPVRVAASFLSSGFHQQPSRLIPYEPFGTIGAATPKKAVILAHDVITILGIDRNWVTDVHQSRFSYGVLRTPVNVHRELSGLGVTHLLWSGQALARDTLASDFAFLGYALNYTEDQRVIAGYTLGRLPKAPPADGEVDPRVVIFSCGSPYPSGIYRLSQLRLPVLNPGPSPRGDPLPADPALALTSAGFVGVERTCHPAVVLGDRFRIAASRGGMELYVSRAAEPSHP